MRVEDVKPWYQQFWPWALISLPATAVVAGLYTYSLAASERDGLVVDDYYKEGKAINRSLERGQRAADLNLAGDLALNGTAIRLVMNNVQVENQQQLTLNLYHATLADHDQTLTLQKMGAGIWQGQLQPLAEGKWYVDLTPVDNSWRLTGVLPSRASNSLALKPAL